MTSCKKAVGRLLMVGIPGDSADDSFLQEIAEYGVGGVIFFSRHLKNPQQVKEDMAKISEACGYEPLYAIDHEGGPVMRFDCGISELPAPMALVAAGGGDLIRKASCLAADELADLGLNTNLAPVCDINEPDNPGIGIRAFSEDPEVVADSVVQAVKGFSDGGLLSTVKHFPGKGAALVDAHLSMPVVDLSKERILRRELPPFRAAINAGAKLLMTSHILFPKLDSRHAATFSRTIVDSLVRQELAFEGIVVTDDLEMGGSRQEAEPAEAALRSILAGHDLALICHTFDAQVRARRFLTSAVEKGDLPFEQVEVSNRRIASALKYLHFLRNQKIKTERDFSRKDMDALAAKGIVVSGNTRALPLRKEDGPVDLYVPDLTLSTPSADDRSGVLSVLEEEFLKVFPSGNVRTFSLEGQPQGGWTTDDVSEKTAVVLTNNAHLHTGQAELVRRVLQLARKKVHVALRNPYDLAIGDDSVSKVATHGFRYNVLQALVTLLLHR